MADEERRPTAFGQTVACLRSMGEYLRTVTGILIVTAFVGGLFSVLYQRSVPKDDQDISIRTKQSDPVTHVNLQLGLDGSDWVLSGNASFTPVPATVPGNMYTALRSAGIIGDPYYRFNDDEYRWVHWENWTYARSFEVTSELANKRAVLLVCEGLDTVATVFINGQEVGSGTNQFVRYVFDITSAISEGTNDIVVEFTSAVQYAKSQHDAHPYTIPPECPPDMYKGECHPNMIRKAACSFSWDWGPSFATQGIWRSIWIEGNDVASIRDVVPLPSKDETTSEWLLNVTVYLDVSQDISGVNVRVELPSVGLSFDLTNVSLTQGEDSVSMDGLRIAESSVDTWWPRGYGAQPLYDLTVTLTDAAEVTVDQKTVRTAFRTVYTVEDPLPSGLTFYFVINGVPIYMKGSNWIPIDSFLDRVTPEKYNELLESAETTNMNTIRIWGGGVYEEDSFYDIADEKGLLIWQDLMFACNMYPVDSAYLQNVQDEMVYQVRRLARHPCLVAWTANNENEGALVDDWYGTSGPMYETYKSDYVVLYIDTIRATILSEDTTRPFLSSSPTNGEVTEQNGWVSEDPKPSSPHYGDIHYYNYNDDCLDYTIYLPSRYASEYGYQSWPSHNTLSKVSKPEDLVYESPFANHRQHSYPAGNGTEQIVLRNFNWPNTGDPQEDFKSIIFLYQATQAMCYKVQTEFYRRARSNPDIQNMGALYWQHSDIWQAPSWATIDFEGNWKMAHYYGRHFFDDPMVSSIQNGSNIDVYTVTDSMTEITDVTLVIHLWNWSSPPGTYLYEWTVLTSVPAAGATLVYSTDLADLLAEGGCPQKEECILTLYLETTANGRISPINPHYLEPWKNVSLLVPGIQVESVTMVADRAFQVILSTNNMAALVWIEAVDVKGYFSDNGFLWVEGPTVTLTFKAWQDITELELSSAITVKSLADIY